MAIRFFIPKGRYGCLSNFSRHGFELDGFHWPTLEHYYQAQKFPGTELAERIREASTPRQAKNLGRSGELPPRADWEQVRDEVMRRAVLRKFESNADAREVLLSTGSEELIEASPTDSYWGCGADGSGRNMLGRILMDVREMLRHR